MRATYVSSARLERLAGESDGQTVTSDETRRNDSSIVKPHPVWDWTPKASDTPAAGDSWTQ